MDLTHALDLKAPAVGYHLYTPEISINFQCNRWIQWIGSHAIPELKEVAGTPRNYEQWIQMFLDLADRADGEGRPVDAAYYVRGAEFFMTKLDSRKLPSRRRFVSALQAAFDVEPTLVGFDGGTLPAYDLSPEQEPNGTWVVFGGFDSYVEEWFPMLAAAVAAGRRLIVFDGPGQGGALMDNDIKMIVEWERPVKAILDHFDLRDVTLVGASLGGELAIRAAAFEPRVSRVVSFDILVNLLEVFMSNVSASRAQKLAKIMPRVPARLMNAYMRALIRRKPLFEWGIEHGMNVTGAESPAAFLRSAKRFDTTDISSRVTCDALLLAGATDHAIPFSMLARQTALLTNARSVTTRRFTEAEHASNHCQIGNIAVMISTVLSWEAGLDAVRHTTEPLHRSPS